MPFSFPPESPVLRLLMAVANEDQRRRYLAPYAQGKTRSATAISEPGAGADPTAMATRAVKDGDHWVLDGRKIWVSYMPQADFTIVLARTAAGRDHRGITAFIVDRDTPGFRIEREIPMLGGHRTYEVVLEACRVPDSQVLGEPGSGFAHLQLRLTRRRLLMGPMCIGMARRALDMMCERAVSRVTKGERLADKQMVQERIADSYTQITQFRLHVLYAAWLLDQDKGYTHRVRREISAIKAAMPGVLRDVVYRALHIHGSLGMSNETPLMDMWQYVPEMGIVDGSTEVHKVSVAKDILRRVDPAPGQWPTYFVPHTRSAALAKFAPFLEEDDL